MSDHLEQVKATIQATVIHSATTYTWFGKQSQPLPPAIKRVLLPQVARSYLLFNLQSQLYTDFYCQGFAAPSRPEAAGAQEIAITPFVDMLSAANTGSGSWEGGWEVRTVEDTGAIVSRGGLELLVRAEDCLIPSGGSIAPGAWLSLRMPKELLSISPGFYMALSNRDFTLDSLETLVRFYWNITPEAAVRLMRSATLLMNQEDVPFKLKMLNDPARFTRCDAAVLYVRRNDYHIVTEILERIYSDVADRMKQGTPMFTKRLAAGLALAEDPDSGESFGQHRCRLLADGIIRAHERAQQPPDGRLRAVIDRFAEDGISLEQPFLNPGSSDDYIFQPQLQRRVYLSRDPVGVHQSHLDLGALLRTADEIGQRLSRDAIWYQDCCNWMGAFTDQYIAADNHSGLKDTALGPELYSGTSGIGMFLAELYAATGDVVARRTALGAIQQALRFLDSIPSPSRIGLFTGWTGIALATARVAAVLGVEELLDSASQLLHRSEHEHKEGFEFDLISGKAGTIAALVALRDLLHDTSLLDFAIRLGDELLQTADESIAGYSWQSAAFPTRRNLTGFSHGTAGVGYALLELFHATGDLKYRRAAELAFEYERHWFDADAGNWPDFRQDPGRGRRRKRPLSFATHWCHGAPGIALSRLRAYEILKDDTCKTEAITALQTTRRMIETSLHSGVGNYSLCHGLAGNAEVLIYGSQILGQATEDATAQALEVAYTGIESYAIPGLSWPCGTGAGETPGLMLGLAGIGYFYLHLHDLATPSLLILQREKLANRRKNISLQSQEVGPMTAVKLSLYRADAVRRYLESREKTVLPRLVSPRTFMYLWILLGLLMLSGFFAWFARVPVYASGPAVVVDWQGKTLSIRDEIMVVAFVPTESLSRLWVEQTLCLQLDRGGERVGRSVIAVEPEISSPDVAQRRFALSAGAVQAITQPSTVGLARLEPIPTGLPATTCVGNVYRGDVEVGSRRVISLLPLIGPLFGE